MRNTINRYRYKHLSVALLTLLVFTPTLLQTTRAETVAASQQDTALAFLDSIVQLDLTNYATSVNKEYSSENHLSLDINAKNASFLDSIYHINAAFDFYNGSVRSCSLSPDLAGLPYTNQSLDRFNSTLGFMMRYQKLTNDPQVQEMVSLLEKVSSEKNVTETQGNLTLTIQCDNILTTYKFRLTFNGAQYTGITVYYGTKTGSFDFNDNRQFQKIGTIDINVSEEQAINIAKEYLKSYSYNTTFGNGTTVKVSNFNVTGVYQAVLQTSVRTDNTLYPQWNIQFNISNMPAPGLQGIGVWVWANDGKVLGAYNYAYPMSFNPVNLLFFPLLFGAFTSLIFVVGVVVIVVLVLLLYLRKDKYAPPPKLQ